VPGYGWIAIGTDDNHQRHRRFRIAIQPISGEEVRFSTQTLNGVSYTFRGRFVDRPRPIEKDSDRDRVILVGTLTRFRDKAVVAEASLRFSYTPGD
jgi:hypothetical protein